jgi:hypothetical protein
VADEVVRFRFTGDSRSAEAAARNTGRAVDDLGDKAEKTHSRFLSMGAALGGKAIAGGGRRPRRGRRGRRRDRLQV